VKYMEADKYRLYIDESGTHGYSGDFSEIRNRYLALSGVIVKKEHYEEHVQPKVEELRSLFTADADYPPPLHLIDIISKRGAFSLLKDSEIEADFNEKYLHLLESSDFTYCNIVLDKQTHKERYGKDAMHPYHYCLSVLLERYVRFLQSINAQGDVIAECRGKKEDRHLAQEFSHFYNAGTYFLDKENIQLRLTSKNIKLMKKDKNIAGLEIADLLAMPFKHLVLKKYGVVSTMSENFTMKALKAAYPKVRRGGYPTTARGYGLKLIK